MRILTIKKSEWDVLFYLLKNHFQKTQGLSKDEAIYQANKIIKEKKGNFDRLIEKYKSEKKKATDKYKATLRTKKKKFNANTMETKILKFESEEDERIQDRFRLDFENMRQDVEGKYL